MSYNYLFVPVYQIFSSHFSVYLQFNKTHMSLSCASYHVSLVTLVIKLLQAETSIFH